MEKDLWNPNLELYKLRKPKTNVTDSVLSVDAAEWFPASLTLQNNLEILDISSENNCPNDSFASQPKQPGYKPSSAQNRLLKYRSAAAASPVDKLDYIHKIIDLLSRDPSKLEDIMDDIQFFEPIIDSIDLVAKSTAAIFYQTRKVPKFQYCGIKLLWTLNKYCPLVRGFLHHLCEKEIDGRNDLNELIPFLADIYFMFDYELFGKCLLNILKKLKPSLGNVKCICHALKIVGAKLEKLDPAYINNLIIILDGLRITAPGFLGNLIQSVLKLRENQWGAIGMRITFDYPTIDIQLLWANGLTKK